MLNLQLLWITDVLVLATAARAEVRTERLDAMRRWPEDIHEPGAREPLLDFGYFRLDLVAQGDEGYKEHELTESGHAFTAESDVMDDDAELLADSWNRFYFDTHPSNKAKNIDCTQS